jgi:hypothetical protein
MSASRPVASPQDAARAGTMDPVGLAHGRLLTVDSAGPEQLVEIRGASGLVELRVKITEGGPVLLIEGVRIALKATEAVDVDSPRFRVTASESIELTSRGTIHVSGEGNVSVNANGEVHVKGEMIFLN